jgi:hypothetical protein
MYNFEFFLVGFASGYIAKLIIEKYGNNKTRSRKFKTAKRKSNYRSPKYYF